LPRNARIRQLEQRTEAICRMFRWAVLGSNQ
jgi:hypothetical protein